MSELIRSTRDVIIRTPDAKAAADFYQQVLGLAITQRVVICTACRPLRDLRLAAEHLAASPSWASRP